MKGMGNVVAHQYGFIDYRIDRSRAVMDAALGDDGSRKASRELVTENHCHSSAAVTPLD